jgi:predicted amidophosphoribosyltransferase
MRDRHFPRLCRSCDAPMARQEDSCWNCGATWDYRLATRDPIRVIDDRGAERPDRDHQTLDPATATRTGAPS